MQSGFASTFSRIAAAVTKRPRPGDWLHAGREAAWLLPILLLFGFVGGLMHWRPVFDAQIVRLAVAAIVVPAFGEELLFRAALLPAPDGERVAWLPVAASSLLFVLWHPAQALLFGPHWAAVVLDPWFLAAVAATGVALSRLYLITGSIWPSVALHWLIVVAWKALLGGPSPWVSP